MGPEWELMGAGCAHLARVQNRLVRLHIWALVALVEARQALGGSDAGLRGVCVVGGDIQGFCVQLAAGAWPDYTPGNVLAAATLQTSADIMSSLFGSEPSVCSEMYSRCFRLYWLCCSSGPQLQSGKERIWVHMLILAASCKLHITRTSPSAIAHRHDSDGHTRLWFANQSYKNGAIFFHLM